MAHAAAAAAVIVSGGSAIDEKNKPKWEELVQGTIDGQADAFLKAFVNEFSGNKFEEVLDIASQFRKFAPQKGAPELEEHSALMFLEKRGETATAAELRNALKQIDVDNNHKVSFLEYALYKWKKTPKVFFEELAKPKGGGEALAKAIAAYRAALAVKEARAAKMEELEAAAAKGGVSGNKARMELAQMKADDETAMNRNEILAGAAKRKAEKNAVDPFEEEKKKLAEEKKKREDEENKKKADSRAKLAAKAALFGGK